jgi:serine/threonine protein kinase
MNTAFSEHAWHGIRKPLFVLAEYCSRGSLYDVLRRARSNPERAAELTWSLRLNMAVDAARGMLYLHTATPAIIHRDVKSPNLLVDNAWRVKVGAIAVKASHACA